ncbi:lanthionine synthetase LanC family protein [Frankia sp. ACN1ag]|uniref:lanthionine synthetase LanC family protein n=1 Tax=Frankia sp. ACN1ag TaxID=102891 RepID=UPI0006DBF5F1|nr:lanthionine synthetase LanC family protein [Frankia sp. ACN1ag]
MTAIDTPADLAGLADSIATRLAIPAVDGPGAAELSQSLARGAPGIVLLHIERARAGRGDWSTVHAWLAAATRLPINAGPDAGLYVGAPAVAFAVHTAAAQSERYQRALTTLHTTVSALTRDRLDRAHRRLARGDPPAFTEFDLLYGLTGLGAYHLHVDPDGDDLRQVLAYLVRLTEPIRRHGEQLPGWWTALSPTRRRTAD